MTREIMLLLAVPVAIAGTMWATTNFERFVLIVIPVAMIWPPPIAQPAGAIVALADALTLLALAIWVVVNAVTRRPRVWIAGNPLLVPALLFWGINAASLLWTSSPRDTLRLTIQLLEFVVITPLLFSSVIGSQRVVRACLTVFTLASLVLAVIALVTVGRRLGSGELEALELPGGLNKNVTGSFIGVGFAFAFVAFLGAQGRLRHLAIAFICAAGTVATFSRGSMLGIVGAALVASLVMRRYRVATVATLVVAATAYVNVLGTDSRITSQSAGAGSFDSSVVRVYSFNDAIEKIKDRPFLGSGSGTYSVYIPELDIGLPDPNNTFLLTWAEIGIFGLITLLFLYVRIAQMFLWARNLPDPDRVLVVAAGCGAVTLLVHFQVDVTWTRGTSQLAFAALGIMSGGLRLAGAIPAATLARWSVPGPAAHAGVHRSLQGRA